MGVTPQPGTFSWLRVMYSDRFRRGALCHVDGRKCFVASSTICDGRVLVGVYPTSSDQRMLVEPSDVYFIREGIR